MKKLLTLLLFICLFACLSADDTELKWERPINGEACQTTNVLRYTENEIDYHIAFYDKFYIITEVTNYKQDIFDNEGNLLSTSKFCSINCDIGQEQVGGVGGFFITHKHIYPTRVDDTKIFSWCIVSTYLNEDAKYQDIIMP